MSELLINDLQIPYQIQKGKKGRISLKIKDGKLWITTESGRLQTADSEFLKKKEKWVYKHFLEQQKKEISRKKFLELLPSQILWQGQLVAIDWKIGKKNIYQLRTDKFFEVYTTQELSYTEKKRAIKEILKIEASRYLKARLTNIASLLQLKVERVSIKAQKSKWGSCSSKRNINLNWHLALLPPILIEYVIYHELLHLQEANHSEQFWKLVEKYVPNYKVLDKQLSEYEWVIGILD
ncbi:MAG: SprT family zinc-dependent metalloprotease [Bacteroidia bacterium]|nr:M48 family metallopeptidase [Bacteroidia bacterium]MDW8159035.1 SprT family zinc-dependent metalloprotease [Bacteroidia bacterium]